MRIILVLLVITGSLMPLMLQAQKSTTIDVKGSSQLKIKPDLTVVNISFSSTNMTFNKAVKDVNGKNDVLVKQLEKNGFKKDEIKSSGFTAGKNIIWSRDRSIDSGYVATQTVILEFPYSKERVTKLVEAFGQSSIGLTFNFNFTLSQNMTRESRNKLIEMAVNDAKEKAAIIANAAGVKLGTVQSIRYGIEVNTPQPMLYKAMARSENAPTGFGDLNVNDIELTDEVVVNWTINTTP